MSETLTAMLAAERKTTFTVPVTVTPRETAVLIATSQGLTQDAMSKVFDVARPTIITTCATVYGKLSAPKAAAAVSRAIRVGLLTDADDAATRADLQALWAAGGDWTAVGTAPVTEAAPTASETPQVDDAAKASSTPKRAPRRSGRTTTRKASPAEQAKLTADAQASKRRNRQTAGVK